MRKVAYKALYLFLCSILGMVLLAMLHRALFVLYDLLLVIDFNSFSLGLSSYQLALIDFFTMLFALFIGGWYGIALGIDWYAMVYGPNAEHKAGWFHGFVPHHWRKKKSAKSEKAVMMPVADNVKVPVRETVREWKFDELLVPKTETKTAKKRTVAKKPVAKKVVRKTATKRTKIIAE